MSLLRWCLILAGAALAACAAPPPKTTAAPPAGPELLVMFQDNVPAHFRPDATGGGYGAPDVRARVLAQARTLATKHHLIVKGDWPMPSLGIYCVLVRPAEDVPLERLLSTLEAEPGVAWAQTVQTFKVLAAKDPYYSLQKGGPSMHLDEMHAHATGRRVTVAQIDTGVDLTHPDLAGRIAESANFIDGDPWRVEAHGTAVAGIIGARADGTGFDGIAPEARLDVFKACWYSDSTAAKARCSSWTLAKAVDHAINHDIKVMNLSLGGRADDLLARLLAAADQRGIVVVVATLENPEDPGFPASLTTVIPAVACDVNGHVAPSHWRGIAFAAAAPGVDVVAPVPHTGYALMSGSSLAAAHITGVVALLLQRAPQATPDQIRTALRTTAKPIAGSNSAGATRIGLVDACAALARQAPQLACP